MLLMLTAPPEKLKAANLKDLHFVVTQHNSSLTWWQKRPWQGGKYPSKEGKKMHFLNGRFLQGKCSWNFKPWITNHLQIREEKIQCNTMLLEYTFQQSVCSMK